MSGFKAKYFGAKSFQNESSSHCRHTRHTRQCFGCEGIDTTATGVGTVPGVGQVAERFGGIECGLYGQGGSAHK